MDLGLAGQSFVVTGASRGLGLAAAQALVDEGAHVALSGRDPGSVRAAAADRLGAVGLAADQADPDSGARLVAAALEAYGRLDGALTSVGDTRSAAPSLSTTRRGGARSTASSSARRAPAGPPSPPNHRRAARCCSSCRTA